MKKTISINLGGRIFYVEEDAFQKLDSYLNSVKTHFAGYPDHADIVADMESRMAEQLADKKTGDSISLSDVENVIKIMGRVEDFGDAGQASPQAEQPQNPLKSKKLYRNTDDVIIAGVCSGIAAYFGVDTTIIRLIFFASIFFGGFGIFLYIILWIVAPEAVTAADKIQMSGRAVNLSSLEQMAKEKVAELKKNDTAKKAISLPGKIIRGIFTAIRAVFKVIIPLIFRLIGLGIVLGVVLALLALVFIFVNLIFNINSPYIDFPIREFISGWSYYALIFAGFFVAFIPALLILLAGTSLLSLKNNLNKIFTFSLMAIWAAAIITAGTLGLRLAPEIQAKMDASPQFKSVQESYDVKDFSSLKASGAEKILLTQGNTFSVTASGRQIDLERLDISVKDGVLNVEAKRGKKICLFCGFSSPGLEIIMPRLDNIEAGGAVRIEGRSFSNPGMDIELSGASRILLENISVGTLAATLDGASKMEISGTTTELRLSLDGASRFNGEGFLGKTATVSAQGASTARVNLSDSLTAKAGGASRIYYFGSAQVTKYPGGSSRIIPGSPEIFNSSADSDWELETPEITPPAPQEPPAPTSTPI